MIDSIAAKFMGGAPSFRGGQGGAAESFGGTALSDGKASLDASGWNVNIGGAALQSGPVPLWLIGAAIVAAVVLWKR